MQRHSRKPLRILQITPYFEDAWAYGGIPRVAGSLCHALARRGHWVTVCTTDVCSATSRLGCSHLPRPMVRQEQGVLDIQVFKNISNRVAYHLQFFSPLGLRTYLRRHAGAFDVAHLHSHHHLLGVIAERELRRARVPYVVAPNGTAGRIERRRWAKWVFDTTVGRRVLPNASRLLAVSHAEETQLEALGVPAAKVRHVRNPIDLTEFVEPQTPGLFRRRFGISAPTIILYLGKLTPRKGVDVLIEAFQRMNDPEQCLVIAGNDMGSLSTLQQQVHGLGLTASVIFAGLLSGKERLEAMTDANVVAYPGRDEIFGLVALEANMCGTPVVVADDSGCGEVQRELGGGLVVPYGDPSLLAGALFSILHDQLQWQEAAEQAKARIPSIYGSDIVAGQLEAIYRELIY